MNRRLFFSLVVPFVIIKGICLGCFVAPALSCPKTQDLALDEVLAKAVEKPNRWGYKVLRYPTVRDAGLTYWLDSTFVLRPHSLSINESQELFIAIYRDHLRNMNDVRIIRPFLPEFPLTPDSCQLNIGFEDATGENRRPPYVASVRLFHENLEFTHFVDLGNIPGNPYTVIHKQAAKEITGLKELYTPILPRKSVDPKPQIPGFSRHIWKYDNEVSQTQITFLQSLGAEAKLCLTTVGTVGKHYFDARNFDFAMWGSQRLNLEEARALSARCCKALLEFARTNQVYKEYIKRSSTDKYAKYAKYPSATPIPEQFAFRISFWDENIDRQPQPYIAEIRLLDGTLSYFTANENQQLVLTFEEPFPQYIAYTKNLSGTKED